jgi:hypothetical protein
MIIEFHNYLLPFSLAILCTLKDLKEGKYCSLFLEIFIFVNKSVHPEQLHIIIARPSQQSLCCKSCHIDILLQQTLQFALVLCVSACNVLYLYTLDTESLTGPQAIKKAVHHMFSTRPLPAATVVHFKVSGQGITLTDNKRQLFFRRHYPVATISYCGLDPDDHRWSQKSDETGMPISSK